MRGLCLAVRLGLEHCSSLSCSQGLHETSLLVRHENEDLHKIQHCPWPFFVQRYLHMCSYRYPFKHCLLYPALRTQSEKAESPPCSIYSASFALSSADVAIIVLKNLRPIYNTLPFGWLFLWSPLDKDCHYFLNGLLKLSAFLLWFAIARAV